MINHLLHYFTLQRWINFNRYDIIGVNIVENFTIDENFSYFAELGIILFQALEYAAGSPNLSQFLMNLLEREVYLKLHSD